MTMLSLDEAAASLESSVRLKSARKRRPGPGSRAHVEVIRAEAEELRREKRWGEMRPSHMVATWAWLYEAVYGVAPEPAEVAPKAFGTAMLAAGKALHESFSGDAERMVSFMRWAWAREKVAKERQPDGRRIGARLMFSAMLIGDWRIATAGRARTAT
jgi:hypothetical protein